MGRRGFEGTPILGEGDQARNGYMRGPCSLGTLAHRALSHYRSQPSRPVQAALPVAYPDTPAPPMHPAISVSNLSKTYASGFQALKSVDLEIRRGEIFALLGPNGAGKTTLISIICGIVNPSTGHVLVDGRDNLAHYREARAKIGLVPQELTTDAFETVWATVSFSRGLFGKP